ncbi:MAG: radical SAM protein [Polyangiaceae bacterium]|jgi:uncharacterized radical SAM superfamily Fe-S cluster-containing enzyme
MSILNAVMKELAELGWHGFQAINRRFEDSASPTPAWAPAPLLKSRERSKPPLGWPRETDSLCPTCVVETRTAILRGERDLADLVDGHVGEIKARIVEENGRLLIRKTCPQHGAFEDVISIDPQFSHLIEQRYHGRDFRTVGDELVHRHGTSTIKYGRGTVLTIDLTNRCNMMCNPCFMDANQVGYVHELTLDEIKEILDASISFKPRRQMTVQFSGGEPTMSPHFLEACRYAKDVGYFNVQAATNGIRFALEPEFAFQAKQAGLDLAYFQFDGTTNAGNSHRHISNLFDVKQKAIDVMHAAGIKILPVTTVVNGVNSDQVWPIFEFVIANCDKLDGVSFQPVSFTGRDEEISDEDRRAQRYTTSHLAHDLERHSAGRIRAHRDFYPLGAMGAFGALADHVRSLKGPDAEAFGAVGCSCHPNCGASIVIAANTRTKAWAPVTQFFNVAQFMEDTKSIVDSARGKELTYAQIALSCIRNFDATKVPPGFSLAEFASAFLRGKMAMGSARHESDWKILWVGGMWFQDLWTYDFRRTEMCVIPYATQEGEISFCAYNTGVGWRQIVENMHAVAKTKEWFDRRGRHSIYAGDRPVALEGKRRLPVLGAPEAPPVGAFIRSVG